MDTTDRSSRCLDANPQRRQFVRAAVVLVLTSICLLFLTTRELPSFLVLHVLLVVPVVLITTIVYGVGYVRTFAIGAMVVWTVDFISNGLTVFSGTLLSQSHVHRQEAVLTVVASGWLLVFGGFVAVVARWLLEPTAVTEEVGTVQQGIGRREVAYPNWLVGDQSQSKKDAGS